MLGCSFLRFIGGFDLLFGFVVLICYYVSFAVVVTRIVAGLSGCDCGGALQVWCVL